MKRRLLFVLLLLCLQAVALFGQQNREDIRLRMWGMADTIFKVKTIPDKWKSESAVILGRSLIFEYKKQALAERINNDVYFRTRILLLDKYSVKEYSEFSFGNLGPGYTWREGSFLGIKVIKPDGTEREINIDEAVKMQKYRDARETKKLNQSYNKLAIDDLGIGDIIDYYFVNLRNAIYRSGSSNFYAFDPEFVVLTEEYPLLNGKLAFLAERGCYINLSASNGAPKPLMKEKGNKDYYEVEYSNLEKQKGELWTALFRQEPLVKFQVVVGSLIIPDNEMNFLGQPLIPKTEVTEVDFSRLLNQLVYHPDTRLKLFKAGTKYLRKQRKSPAPETLASDLFYFMRNYLYFNHFFYYNTYYQYRVQYNRFEFIQIFSALLRSRSIDHDVFLSVKKEIGSIDEVLLLGEITPGIRLMVDDKPVYIVDPLMHSRFGESVAGIENTRILKTTVRNGGKGVDMISDSIGLSSPLFSQLQNVIQIGFVQDNPEKLDIHHNFTLSGYQKNDYVVMFQGFEDARKSDSELMKEIALPLSGNQNAGNAGPEEENKEGLYEERKESLTKLMKITHQVTDVELDSFRLISFGRTEKEADLVFECSLKAGGLVKKANNYIVVEAGKMIGRNIDLNAREKERTRDIYMEYPRSYKWVIEIDIPDGYAPGNLENFNMSVENSTGSFTSNGMVNGNKVSLIASKYYTHEYEPVAHWPELLQVLELANAFVQQKLVFKKIQE